jgi:phage/plasmid-like protein (TIGR03299 family)
MDIHSVHSSGYVTHDYKAHLFDNAVRLLGDDVQFSSAGILARGGVAWIELSIAETMTKEGFSYRPHLLGHTSSNGRFETGFGRKIQATVCDNTLNVAYGETGQSISWRHTAGSLMRIKDAADALGIIMNEAAQFEAELEDLLRWGVRPQLFSRWLDEMIPVKGKDGMLLDGAALTRVERKREEMAGMWNGDERVAPYSGTALGILQLSNTWQHHKTGITKATVHRLEKNMLGAISGKTAESDKNSLGILKGLSEAYGFMVPEKFEHLEVPKLATIR